MDEDMMGMEVFEFPELDVPSPDEIDRDEEYQALVRRQIEEALDWREQYLDPEQETATNYYMGKQFGDELEGRSKVVSTDVRDAVQAIMPSLLRVFCGPERVVEFKPESPEDTPMAAQQTDYVNYVFMEDNPGFLTMYSAFKDAMVRKMGIVKWWWEEKTKVVGSQHSGLTYEEVLVLAQDVDVEDYEVIETQPAETDEEGNEIMPALYDCSVQRRVEDGRVRVAAIPPEEFVFSPSARSLDDARMIGHVRYVPADELIAMGVPEDMVARAKGGTRRTDREQLTRVRRIDNGGREIEEDEQDDSTRPVRFAEVYVRYDMDEDGIAECRRIQAVGDACEFFTNELADDIPFALFGPDPEPHTLVGLSVADYVKDLQRIKSAIMRGMLDSLSLSLNPATEVVEGEVNMKDVMGSEVGRIIRVRRPGQMREVATPFVGAAALPVLEYTDQIKQDRLGISKAAAGLDADALQSSTKAAVAATLTASQQRMEMIARIFAETGMKQLFKGILRLVVKHQDKPRMIRLKNQWVPVDPKHWHAELDVVVNVALGAGLTEEKMQYLALIAEKQEQNIQQGSPLVGLSEYRHTLGRMTELAGFKDSTEFWKPFGPEEEAAHAQQQAEAAQNQPPDPTEAFLQVEMAKIQQQAQEKQAELEFRMQEMQLRHQREVEKIIRDFVVKQAAIQARYATDVSDAEIQQQRNMIEANRVRVQDDKTENDAVLGLMDRIQTGVTTPTPGAAGVPEGDLRI